MKTQKKLRHGRPRLVALFSSLCLIGALTSIAGNARAEANDLGSILDSKKDTSAKLDAIAGFIAKNESRSKSDVLKKMRLDAEG